MTAITTKSGQMRFDSCVLTLPKWAKIQEKRGKCACGTLRADDLAADTAIIVENVHESAQAPQNTTLLGKYRFNLLVLTNLFRLPPKSISA